jgi:hypothetical protein
MMKFRHRPWFGQSAFQASRSRRKPSRWPNASTGTHAEILECRTLLATITVTSLADNSILDGQVTL